MVLNAQFLYNIIIYFKYLYKSKKNSLHNLHYIYEKFKKNFEFLQEEIVLGNIETFHLNILNIHNRNFIILRML